MSAPLFTHGLSEAEVVRLLSSPQVCERLGEPIGGDVSAIPLSTRQDTYEVTGPSGQTTSGGRFIVRFARDEAHLSTLRKEERVQAGLRDRVTLLIPDTRVIDDLDGHPVFAIHQMIVGGPLVKDCYTNVSPPARERLIRDLVRFFHETHSVPLELACDWLDIPFDGEGTAAKLAPAYGKPLWFGPDAVAEMRPQLEPIIKDDIESLFEDTVHLFAALEINPDYMVFGHGDIHGYNVAMGQDGLGPKIVGVFDLGCAGILDIHEDFFRLSLVSEELLEQVLAAYQSLPGQTRSLKRDRLAIYYRAFLFHLMVGKTGKPLDHLKTLMRKHIDYYDATYGGLG